MPVGEISAAISSLKAAFDLTKAMKDVRDATIIQGTVFELQRIIMEAQESAIDARAAHASKVDRVAELEKEVANLKTWGSEKQRYELKDLRRGFFAYIPKVGEERGEPAHALCTNCYQKGVKSILQCSGHAIVHDRTWDCPACKTKIKCQWNDMAELTRLSRE